MKELVDAVSKPFTGRTIMDPIHNDVADSQTQLGLSARDSFGAEQSVEAPEYKVILLVPNGTVIPRNDVTIAVINDFIDLALAYKDGAVACSFTSLRVLDMVLRDAKLFRVRFVVLTGVPEAVYDGRFMGTTANLAKYNWQEMIEDEAKQSALRLAGKSTAEEDDLDANPDVRADGSD